MFTTVRASGDKGASRVNVYMGLERIPSRPYFFQVG